MAQLPYYALNQGNLQLQQTQDVVDEYAPLREGLNQAQKYFEQKEAVETSKIMSKARSDWSIRMNEMQQQAGLDYEGFSEKVNQGLQDYENEIINSVPYSQRDKFAADFAGLKYDMLNKAGAYEVTASAERIKLDVEEIQNNWGNVILSDPSQYEAGREAISEMIDGLQAADSVKDALRKEAFNGLAVSQVNALTNINPNYLLNQLKGGAFDSVLDPKQKAASINQAIAKIKSNKTETEKRANEIVNETFRNDLLKIRGGITDIEFEKMIANPVYAKDAEKMIKLQNAYYKFRDDKENNLQTTLDIEKGVLMNPAAADQKRIDYAVEPLLNEIQTFDNKAKAVDKIMRQTNYVPRYWSGTLFNMSNSSNPDERKVAYSQWYDIKTRYPNALTSIEKSKSDELFIKGAALHAGMTMSEIEKKWDSQFDEKELARRDEQLKKVIDGGIDFDIDSNDAFAKNKAIQLFSSAYRMMPDTKAAKAFTETVINANYGNSMVGAGNADINTDPKLLDYFIGLPSVPRVNQKVFMFQPPEKVYGVIGESAEWNAKWMNDDLRMAVAEEFPDIDFKDVILDQNVLWGSDGRPVYYVTTKDGVNLFPWRPDYNEYIRTKKEKEIADKKQSDKIRAEKKDSFSADALKGVL